MAELMLVNPRKRRKARKSAPKKAHKRTRSRRVARKHNPVGAHHARRHVRRRRNPAVGHAIGDQLKHALTGALGGVAVDVVAGYVVPKLPASMQGGYIGKVVKVGLAVALGMVAQKSKLVKGPTAARLVEGAMTVEMYDLARTLVGSAMPNIRLAGAGDEFGEFIPVGEYIPVSGDDDLSGATADRLLSGNDDYLSGEDMFSGIADDFGGVFDSAPNAYDMALPGRY